MAMNENNCLTCKYYRGTNDNGTTKCEDPDQWNTWIRPENGCEKWKEGKHVGNLGTDYPSDI